MSLPLLLGSYWALLLLALSLGSPRWIPERVGTGRRAWLSLAVVALVARLVPNFLLPVGASYDIESYQVVADLVLEGSDVYTSPEAELRHPYLPLQIYWIVFARLASSVLHFSFVKIVRLAPIFADALVALLLYAALLRTSTPRRAFSGGLSYALHPIPIMVAAYHGQFDAIPTLFLLLALLSSSRAAGGAGAWLGFGILSKSWPVLALPGLIHGFRQWRSRLLFLVFVTIVPLVGVFVYTWIFHAHPVDVLRRALSYNRGVGAWGYTYLLRLLSIAWPETGWLFRGAMIDYGRILTLAFLGFFWIGRIRKETTQAGVLTMLVAFLATTHAFSIQYLAWVVPFAVLEREDRWLARFTLGAFAYMFFVYHTLILDMQITRLLPWPQADWFLIMPSGLPAWLITVGWAADRWFGKAKNPVESKGWRVCDQP